MNFVMPAVQIYWIGLDWIVRLYRLSTLDTIQKIGVWEWVVIEVLWVILGHAMSAPEVMSHAYDEEMMSNTTVYICAKRATRALYTVVIPVNNDLFRYEGLRGAKTPIHNLLRES